VAAAAFCREAKMLASSFVDRSALGLFERFASANLSLGEVILRLRRDISTDALFETEPHLELDAASLTKLHILDVPIVLPRRSRCFVGGTVLVRGAAFLVERSSTLFVHRYRGNTYFPRWPELGRSNPRSGRPWSFFHFFGQDSDPKSNKLPFAAASVERLGARSVG